MKVCTDACLFAAWLADELEKMKVENILDIGSGTGLLSLMIAQKNPANIHAVEIDKEAAKQATENFSASPWSDRLKVFHGSIQDYQPAAQYDFICSNPPFFENDLKSSNEQRNTALHSSDLSSGELIASIKRLLRPTGHFALLLPYHRSAIVEQLAIRQGFYLHKKISVQQTEKHVFFRSMLMFGSGEKALVEKTMIIREKGEYSADFTLLLTDYYLYL